MADFLETISSAASIASTVGGAVIGALVALYARAKTQGAAEANLETRLKALEEIGRAFERAQEAQREAQRRSDSRFSALESGPERAATTGELSTAHRRVDDLLHLDLPKVAADLQALRQSQALADQGYRTLMERNEEWSRDIRELLLKLAASDVRFVTVEGELRVIRQKTDSNAEDIARLQGRLDGKKG